MGRAFQARYAATSRRREIKVSEQTIGLALGNTLAPGLMDRLAGKFGVTPQLAEPGTVVQEIQTGYMIRDRLLRPALVGVAKKPD